jgi:aldehyde dehydrogenase (NAD+)
MAISSGQPFSIRHPDRFFIGGEWVRSSSSALFDVITPSTEDLYCRVAEAAAADVDRVVAAARLAFDRGPWPKMSHAERAGYLKAMAREVATRADDLGEVWISEVGVISSVAKATVQAVADTYGYYASLADTFEFQERHEPRAGGNVGLLVREAVGVVGAIVPWNGALGLIAYKIAPALLAGCTVIIKSSPESPGAALMMAEVAQSVGLPPGVVNVITANREVSELLVRHPDVDKITFTGSSAAGKKIGAICGERIARCTLELGGKSAAVILDDCDLGEASRSICGSAILLSGQVCSSLTRLVVSRHRHDDFVEALSAAFRDVKVGDPFAEEIQMGPLAMRRQRERVEHYIAKGREEGATVAAGGGRPRHLDRGFFVEPTVFANVDNTMTIAREEIFGPVVSVIPVADEQTAIGVANDTVFGLNASVFTRDATRAYDVARQLRAGTVGHNSWRTDFSIAFGGFKQSGIGREGGREGLLPFLEVKTVILDDEP